MTERTGLAPCSWTYFHRQSEHFNGTRLQFTIRYPDSAVSGAMRTTPTRTLETILNVHVNQRQSERSSRHLNIHGIMIKYPFYSCSQSLLSISVPYSKQLSFKGQGYLSAYGTGLSQCLWTTPLYSKSDLKPI